MSEDMIHVGRRGDGAIFIGCTCGYEMCKLPLTARTMHTLAFSEDDATFLIRALKKELRPKVKGGGE